MLPSPSPSALGRLIAERLPVAERSYWVSLTVGVSAASAPALSTHEVEHDADHRQDHQDVNQPRRHMKDAESGEPSEQQNDAEGEKHEDLLDRCDPCVTGTPTEMPSRACLNHSAEASVDNPPHLGRLPSAVQGISHATERHYMGRTPYRIYAAMVAAVLAAQIARASSMVRLGCCLDTLEWSRG